jgi:hypothetical protein
VRLRIVSLACALLAGCGGADGPTVIDGSSQAAFEQTLGEARSDLGPRDRLKFEAALTEFRGQMFAKADNRQQYNRLVREGMDGLTAPGIVAQFNKDVDRVSGQAADAVFDAKRALKGL